MLRQSKKKVFAAMAEDKVFYHNAMEQYDRDKKKLKRIRERWGGFTIPGVLEMPNASEDCNIFTSVDGVVRSAQLFDNLAGKNVEYRSTLPPGHNLELTTKLPMEYFFTGAEIDVPDEGPEAAAEDPGLFARWFGTSAPSSSPPATAPSAPPPEAPSAPPSEAPSSLPDPWVAVPSRDGGTGDLSTNTTSPVDHGPGQIMQTNVKNPTIGAMPDKLALAEQRSKLYQRPDDLNDPRDLELPKKQLKDPRLYTSGKRLPDDSLRLQASKIRREEADQRAIWRAEAFDRDRRTTEKRKRRKSASPVVRKRAIGERSISLFLNPALLPRTAGRLGVSEDTLQATLDQISEKVTETGVPYSMLERILHEKQPIDAMIVVYELTPKLGGGARRVVIPQLNGERWNRDLRVVFRRGVKTNQCVYWPNLRNKWFRTPYDQPLHLPPDMWLSDKDATKFRKYTSRSIGSVALQMITGNNRASRLAANLAAPVIAGPRAVITDIVQNPVMVAADFAQQVLRFSPMLLGGMPWDERTTDYYGVRYEGLAKSAGRLAPQKHQVSAGKYDENFWKRPELYSKSEFMRQLEAYEADFIAKRDAAEEKVYSDIIDLAIPKDKKWDWRSLGIPAASASLTVISHGIATLGELHEQIGTVTPEGLTRDAEGVADTFLKSVSLIPGTRGIISMVFNPENIMAYGTGWIQELNKTNAVFSVMMRMFNAVKSGDFITKMYMSLGDGAATFLSDWLLVKGLVSVTDPMTRVIIVFVAALFATISNCAKRTALYKKSKTARQFAASKYMAESFRIDSFDLTDEVVARAGQLMTPIGKHDLNFTIINPKHPGPHSKTAANLVREYQAKRAIPKVVVTEDTPNQWQVTVQRRRAERLERLKRISSMAIAKAKDMVGASWAAMIRPVLDSQYEEYGAQDAMENTTRHDVDRATEMLQMSLNEIKAKALAVGRRFTVEDAAAYERAYREALGSIPREEYTFQDDTDDAGVTDDIVEEQLNTAETFDEIADVIQETARRHAQVSEELSSDTANLKEAEAELDNPDPAVQLDNLNTLVQEYTPDAIGIAEDFASEVDEVSSILEDESVEIDDQTAEVMAQELKAKQAELELAEQQMRIYEDKYNKLVELQKRHEKASERRGKQIAGRYFQDYKDDVIRKLDKIDVTNAEDARRKVDELIQEIQRKNPHYTPTASYEEVQRGLSGGRLGGGRLGGGGVEEEAWLRDMERAYETGERYDPEQVTTADADEAIAEFAISKIEEHLGYIFEKDWELWSGTVVGLHHDVLNLFGDLAVNYQMVDALVVHDEIITVMSATRNACETQEEYHEAMFDGFMTSYLGIMDNTFQEEILETLTQTILTVKEELHERDMAGYEGLRSYEGLPEDSIVQIEVPETLAQDEMEIEVPTYVTPNVPTGLPEGVYQFGLGYEEVDLIPKKYKKRYNSAPSGKRSVKNPKTTKQRKQERRRHSESSRHGSAARNAYLATRRHSASPPGILVGAGRAPPPAEQSLIRIHRDAMRARRSRAASPPLY